MVASIKVYCLLLAAEKCVVVGELHQRIVGILSVIDKTARISLALLLWESYVFSVKAE